jgi:hypothetical protein
VSKRDDNRDAAICKHVDAITVLLHKPVVGLMVAGYDGTAELVTPEDNLEAAAHWIAAVVLHGLRPE